MRQIRQPLVLVDPRGRQGHTPPLGPISFILMQCLTKTLRNNRFSFQTQGSRLSPKSPPPPASPVWEILGSPLFSAQHDEEKIKRKKFKRTRLVYRDGTRKAITEWKSCNLARVPSHAVMTSSNNDRNMLWNFLNEAQVNENRSFLIQSSFS